MNHPLVNLSFGAALDYLKEDAPIRRAGWNGKGMFIFLNHGSYNDKNEHVPELIEGIDRDLFESGHTGTVTRLPNINMRAASGSTVTGWLASQTDLLAEDWQVAPFPEDCA